MKPGDLVRFRTAFEGIAGPWKEGLLLKYTTWEKIAHILYEGEVVKKHGADVQLVQRAPENLKNQS